MSNMQGVFAGDDEDGLAAALETAGVDLARIDGFVNRPALEDAGIVDADLFVLTDVSQATAIPIARELNEELRIVVYGDDSLPEFVSGQEVLAIDPALLGPDAVADELV